MGKRKPVSTLAAVGQARRLIDHKPGPPADQPVRRSRPRALRDSSGACRPDPLADRQARREVEAQDGLSHDDRIALRADVNGSTSSCSRRRRRSREPAGSPCSARANSTCSRSCSCSPRRKRAWSSDRRRASNSWSRHSRRAAGWSRSSAAATAVCSKGRPTDFRCRRGSTSSCAASTSRAAGRRRTTSAASRRTPTITCGAWLMRSTTAGGPSGSTALLSGVRPRSCHGSRPFSPVMCAHT